MLFTLLESRLVDILLIGAALYFIFPGIFKRSNTRRQATSQQERKTVYQTPSKEDDKKGEYIDYEEIK